MSLLGQKLTACSFFAGGGLLDYAFKDLFRIIWANEVNPSAARSYQENVGDHVAIEDITALDIDDIPCADLYIGGPPCTDYSSGGANRGEVGDSGNLVWTYLQIVRKKMPKVFLFENVSGMKNRHADTLHRLVHSFEELGYLVSYEEMEATHYGNPSDRKRLFIVGIRFDLGFTFQFPRPRSFRKNVRDAIWDLPAPTESSELDLNDGSIPNHVVTWTSPSPERILHITNNPKLNQWHPLRRLQWDKQCHTLLSHIAKDGREFLHPSENRKITVREMLRLMDVPDSYVIPLEIKITQQYRLVGNGVAYPVGQALARAIYEQLKAVLRTG
ncbi:DNA (cytosine-5-)-methyltransferase [Brevibacillus sp. AG]|uniref:DNA cytosine methyltransferase n=1 Tax=Brevibacillus sp. AG TaxID=3020891 RepID=UPI00232BDC12|nr:DNA (cytosine-5-)-methyltransferase [Brevibacillus sp. AG]MDC0764860.1 DNA (cytosine-5-)-methyltransferase [Brevibacillus sp. AG]